MAANATVAAAFEPSEVRTTVPESVSIVAAWLGEDRRDHAAVNRTSAAENERGTMATTLEMEKVEVLAALLPANAGWRVPVKDTVLAAWDGRVLLTLAS